MQTAPWGWIIFALALVMRLLFWQATADAEWSHSAFYKGDAVIWLDYATAIQNDAEYELGLPLRPPGNAYLIAALWDGQPGGLGRLKLLWCIFGAATASCFYLAARRGFGLLAGCVVGFGVALAHGWMVFSTSLNNETPYLFVVSLLFMMWHRLATSQPVLTSLFGWGVLNALGCLLRVEHALVFVLLTAVLFWRWTLMARQGTLKRTGLRRRSGVAVGWILASFSLVLLPWHLKAWQACEQFNHQEPEVNAATERTFQQLESALAGVQWSDEALAERQRLPAASRRTMGNFVAATMFVRGRRQVEEEDFRVLEEAFGARPTALGEHPFVALYGGLNFYLANNAQAVEGFSRGPLNAQPPLKGGIARYPAPLVAGLPPANLALTYPPHLAIVNQGYGQGLEWIRQHPGEFMTHAWRKARVAWDGATLGFGGGNLPFGSSGLRRRVDVVVPLRTGAVHFWQLGWGVVMLFGLSRVGRARWLAFTPWAVLALGKGVVTVAFFGYARQGIGLAPVLFLLLAVAIEAWLSSAGSPRGLRLARTMALAAVVSLLLVESVRHLRPPTLLLGGREVTAEDPWPSSQHENRTLEVRGRRSPSDANI